jgi:DNA repair exonuclease SbcCD nuclease subunit
MDDILFNKCVAFTDIHFGKSSNSDAYNQKCIDFVKWACEQAIAYNADTCVFLGDWFDSRISVHVKTMQYAMAAFELLSATFKNTYVILGNHDIYHRSRRDFTSIELARNVPNVQIITDPIVLGSVALVPWLVGDEWKEVKKFQAKYMFGHLELPSFLMNAIVEMPDHGALNCNDLRSADYVFSGHFHRRQNKNNIWYIGNAFPQNYTDAWDDDRGLMFLEWGGEPTFAAWPDQPVYRTYNLSQIIDNPGTFLTKNVNARITVDEEMTYEEAQYLRDAFIEAYGAEDIKFIQKHSETEDGVWEGDISFQSVDQIVIDGLKNIDNGSVYDKQMLIDLYSDL